MELDTIVTDEAKVERLALLLEEASEVIQVVGKTLRHGEDSYHPNTPEITNKMLLEEEIADFFLAVTLMTQEGDIDLGRINQLIEEKKEKKNTYLHANTIAV